MPFNLFYPIIQFVFFLFLLMQVVVDITMHIKKIGIIFSSLFFRQFWTAMINLLLNILTYQNNYKLLWWIFSNMVCDVYYHLVNYDVFFLTCSLPHCKLLYSFTDGNNFICFCQQVTKSWRLMVQRRCTTKSCLVSAHRML